MEEYLRKLFHIGDTNGDGLLQPVELANLLKLSGFQLDAEQIIAMVLAADLNGDGVIEYEEFVSMAIELMHTEQTVKHTPQHSLERNWTSVSESEMRGYLHQLFSIADTNGDIPCNEHCHSTLSVCCRRWSVTAGGIPQTDAAFWTAVPCRTGAAGA